MSDLTYETLVCGKDVLPDDYCGLPSNHDGDCGFRSGQRWLFTTGSGALSREEARAAYTMKRCARDCKHWAVPGQDFCRHHLSPRRKSPEESATNVIANALRFCGTNMPRHDAMTVLGALKNARLKIVREGEP